MKKLRVNASVALAVFGATVLAGPVAAATQVVREPEPPSPPASLRLAGYSLYGEVPQSFVVTNGPAAYKTVSGRFDGAPLKYALYSIVPGGYRIYAQGHVDMSAPVHWWGRDVQWTGALQGIAGSSNLLVEVDGAHRAVLVRPNPGPPSGVVAASARPLDGAAATQAAASSAGSGAAGLAGSSFESYGQDVPLSQAMKMLVPAGWGSYIEPPAPFDLKVSWANERSWVEALRDIAAAKGLTCDIDVNQRLVRMRAPWRLTAGGTLKSELEQWAFLAGWRVVWKMDSDWKVPAGSSFEGNFAHAVEQVVETMHSQGAPIGARFWQNSVVEIYQTGE